MKYEAIHTNSSSFSVRMMCKVLGITRGAYYNWLVKADKKKEKRRSEIELAGKVKKVFEENKCVYGYRKMWKELNKTMDISEYKVRKIMNETGLYSIVSEKFKPAGSKKADGKYYINLVEQNFNVQEMNKVWAGDITYIKTTVGRVYLAAVMDLFNREIIEYAVGKHIDTELTKRALVNAVAKRGVSEGLIHHSDRGSQYASKGYQKLLEEEGIIGSMSRAGCPYDNACIERFFSSAKRESIQRRTYENIEEVKSELFEYIEIFYNRKRMHETLGYMSPVEYRMSLS